MGPVLPQPRRATYVGFLLAGLGCAALAAGFGGAQHDTYWWRIAHDLTEALATTLLGVFTISGLIAFWQQRRWRKASQWIAFDLPRRAMRHAAIIASQATLVCTGDEQIAFEVYEAYDLELPLTEEREKLLHHLSERVSNQLSKLFAPDLARLPEEELRAVVERASGASGPLEERSDRLRATVRDLGGYLEFAQATAVFTAAVKLDGKVRELTAQGPIRAGAVGGLLLAAQVSVIQDMCLELAKALSAGYEEILQRATISDDELKKDLADKAWEASRADVSALEFIEADLEYRLISDRADQLVKEISQGMSSLEENVREWLEERNDALRDGTDVDQQTEQAPGETKDSAP
jgi:hypothetical protein